ncbi:MAG: hypothetical protein HWQ38_13710 [Nostoc sp. NMS7]|uniref:hypothetical protein n=1 Tax=unclassified Nostoc TaxID=2593658 RepID=UPI0025DB92F1|nr:hypothetical protein [Nostoc sp. NMS7]MBN3947460.1 hypothetical protein [Nostoc sp. NMS7]
MRMEKVAIALKAKRSQSIFSLTAESSADVDYWSHEWGVGGKSLVKIRFGSSFRLMYTIFKISFLH